ncbi:MAG: hypothetical protein A2Z95_01225 [Gallionellales bacterium GWA2_60_18]|nr:MAG: hypothetical protein A2Z95_01225 [Gallionellales bacterium GWA2_60_18]
MRRSLLKIVALAATVMLCSGLLAGCAQAARSPAPATSAPLTPVRTLQGARLLLDATPGRITFGPLTRFIFPVAVAASPFEIYVADAGAGRLYRYDPALDAMSVMPDVTVTPQTRLQLGSDGSVYVASPGIAPLRRYARDGSLLLEIAPNIGAARYDDIALDRISGMVYGLDRTFGRIEEVHPLGRSATLLSDSLTAESPAAIAQDGQWLYLANQRCGCIVATDLQRRTQSVLARGFRSPAALAADDGWLVVLDNVERKLSVYHGDRLRGTAKLESLQLIDPRSIMLNNGLLYAADAVGNKIAVFRLNQ